MKYRKNLFKHEVTADSYLRIQDHIDANLLKESDSKEASGTELLQSKLVDKFLEIDMLVERIQGVNREFVWLPYEKTLAEYALGMVAFDDEEYEEEDCCWENEACSNCHRWYEVKIRI